MAAAPPPPPPPATRPRRQTRSRHARWASRPLAHPKPRAHASPHLSPPPPPPIDTHHASADSAPHDDDTARDAPIRDSGGEIIQLGGELASGTYKQVHHATWNSVPVAVLIMDSDAMAHEAAILEAFEKPHPNLVQFYGSCRLAGRECLVMEVAEYGSLDTLLRRFASLRSLACFDRLQLA